MVLPLIWVGVLVVGTILGFTAIGTFGVVTTIDTFLQRILDPTIIVLLVGSMAVLYIIHKTKEITERTLLYVLAGIAVLGFALFVFPTIADGTIGQNHYTMIGTVTLSAPAGPFDPVNINVSNIRMQSTGFICNQTFSITKPMCLFGFCSGNDVIISVDGKSDSIGAWNIGSILQPTWSQDFKIGCLAKGDYTLTVKAMNSPNKMENQYSIPISVP